MGDYVTIKTASGKVYAHRVLAQRWLGRPLRADEVVHHIDLDGYNNLPGNLQVATRAQHAASHNSAGAGVPCRIPVPTLAAAADRYAKLISGIRRNR